MVPECRGEECVEDGVHTGVGVGQHMAHDLDKDNTVYTLRIGLTERILTLIILYFYCNLLSRY